MSAKDAPDKGADPIPHVEASLDIAETSINKQGLKRHAEDSRMDGKKNRSPADSIQSVYTKPGYETDAKIFYSADDRGPFTVFVSRKELDPSSGTSLKILKVAQFLHNNNIKGIIEGGIKALGRNKISVNFKTPEEANSFAQNSLLESNGLLAHIPRFHVFRLGVVKNIPTEWTLEELISGISTPSYCGEVVRARRLNFKSSRDGTVTWVPSNTVVLTFTGQRLPEKIFCFNASLPVSIYHLPTIQCRNCCRFGHISKQCRSKPRCFRCAQPHAGENCSIPDSESSCFLCHGGRHTATDPRCPEHSRQKSIKILMSEENISYVDASKRFPQVRPLYADIAASSSPSLQNQDSVSHPANSFNSSVSKSYNKTVFLPSRPKPVLSKSYDVQAHNSITQSPNSCQPNGCALNASSDPSPLLTPNDNLVELLLCSLINMLSKLSDSPLPSNVSALVDQLFTLLVRNNHPIHSPNTPMEL